MAYSYDIDPKDLETDDDNKLADVINRWYINDSERKYERAITWSQSLNYIAGNQWIRYNTHDHRWDTIPVTNKNRHIDRPTTNHINRWIRTNASSFTNRPITSIEPNSDEPEDKTAARLAEVVKDFLYEEQDKDEQYYELALWSLICGICIKKSYKKFTNKFIEKDGKRVYLKVPDSMPLSPYLLTFDGIPTRFRDVQVTMECDVQRVDKIKEEFGQTIKDQNLDIQEEKLRTSILTLKEGLKNIVENSSNQSQTSNEWVDIKNSAVKKEVYVRPSRKWPQGRMIVAVGKHILYKGPSPYYYLDGLRWHPYTFANYHRIPGNIWGMGLAQQLVPIQRRINSIDALLALNRKTMAVPTWLIPTGVNVPEGTRIGIPGQEVPYNPDPATGAKPEPIPGFPLPSQIIEEREMLIRDGEQIAQAGDIRSGKNPSGVTTATQLRILTEETERSRAKQVSAWEKFIEESEQLDLLNFQSCYEIPDQNVYRKFKRINKDITEFDWSKFIGAELRDNANIRVEKGSTLQKSRFLRQQTIMDLANSGLLGDFMSDPYKFKKFLEEFGLSEMFGESEVDVSMAEKINEKMLSGIFPPIEKAHDPDVHLIVLARFMKSPKFTELKPKIKLLFNKRFEMLVGELAKHPIQTEADDPAGAIREQEENEAVDITNKSAEQNPKRPRQAEGASA